MSQLTDKTEKTILAALLDRVATDCLSDTGCRDLLQAVLQSGRTECPGCGSTVSSDRQLQAYRSGGRLCCKSCGRWFDHRTGTILAGTSLSAREIILLVLLIGQGLPVKEIAGRLDLHEGTVRDWRARMSLAAPQVLERQG